MASVLQIFDMNMWNYGPDVMDALLGLIISLVCGFWASLKLLYLMTFFFLWRKYGEPSMIDFNLTILQASSNGKYVESCLEMLVSSFTPPFSFMDMLKQPRGIAKKDQVLSRVHLALKHIADLVPLAPSKLCPIISRKMPIYEKEPVSSISTSQYELWVRTWYGFFWQKYSFGL